MTTERPNAIVLCDDYGIGRVVLDALHAHRIRTWLIYGKGAGALRYSRLSKPLLGAHRLNEVTTEIIAAIDRINHDFGVGVIIPCDVSSALVLNAIRESLDPPIFPIASDETLQLLNDKWAFYHLCQRLDIAMPVSDMFSPDTLTDATERFAFPVIIKPTDKSGGAGVALVRDRGALLDYAKANRIYRHLLVQEYIEGRDIGLSLFARQGQIIALTTFLCGVRLRTEFANFPAFAAAVQRIIAATDYTGVANFDARLTQTGEVKLLECNPRFFARLTALRLARIDYLAIGIPGLVTALAAMTPIAFARRDLAWVGRSLHDPILRQIMLRSWREYLADPLPDWVNNFRHVGRLTDDRIPPPRLLQTQRMG